MMPGVRCVRCQNPRQKFLVSGSERADARQEELGFREVPEAVMDVLVI